MNTESKPEMVSVPREPTEEILEAMRASIAEYQGQAGPRLLDPTHVWQRNLHIAMYKAALAATPAPAAPQEGWQPIETAPLGSFMVWIPSTNMAWPAYKQNDGRLFSNAHGVLNEPYIDGRTLAASHWRPKLGEPK